MPLEAASLTIAAVALCWVATVMPNRARGERGAFEDSFMTKVVKVSLIVMLVAGGVVWLLDRADDGPPDSGSGENAPQQPARHPDGGTKNR